VTNVPWVGTFNKIPVEPRMMNSLTTGHTNKYQDSKAVFYLGSCLD